MRETLAGALPVKAVKDLLVISGLVAVLLQIGSSVWGILCQHQLHVSTQEHTLAVEQQHGWVQPTAYSTICIYTQRGERIERKVITNVKTIILPCADISVFFLFFLSHHDTVGTVWCNAVPGHTSAGWSQPQIARSKLSMPSERAAASSGAARNQAACLSAWATSVPHHMEQLNRKRVNKRSIMKKPDPVDVCERSSRF